MNDTTYGAVVKDAEAAVAAKNINPASCAFDDIRITQRQVDRFCLGKRIRNKINRLEQKIKRRLMA